MSINQKYNIPFNQGVAVIKEFILAQRQNDDQIRLRHVNILNGDVWVTLIAVGHLCPHKPTEDLLYKDVALRETWFSVDQFLDDLANNTIRTGTDQGTLKNSLWEQSLLPSDNDQWEHPGMLFNVSLQQFHVANPNAPLLDYDKPYYSDASDAVREWLSINDWHGFSDRRCSRLLMFIPERRIHFSSIQRSSDTAVVIGITKSIVEPAKIKGAWSINNMRTRVEVEANQGDVELDVPIDAQSVELFLIDQDNTIYDYHRENALNFSEHRTRILGGNTTNGVAQDLLNRIQHGEDQFTEFKEFVDPDDKGGPDKIGETIASVIAFANGGGGVIVIGVTDNGDIVDIMKGANKWRSHLNKAASGTQEELVAQYVRALQKRIIERVRPRPDMRVEVHELNGSSIAAVMVETGQAKPYQDIKTKIVYVRHGASNMRPEKEELKELCCETVQNPWAKP